MTTEIRLFQRFQPKVDRDNAKACQICGTKFTLLVPNHQCKRCLRSVCGGCGLTKRDVFKPKMARKPHRLCKLCALQSNILIQYISANKLKFGQDSDIAKKWQAKLPAAVHLQTNLKQQRKFTVQIFNQLWDAYNFSLRQFIGLITYNISQGDVYKLINTVYMQLQSRGIQQKIQNVIFIIIFLLCFSNTETCTDLVEYLCGLKKIVADQKQLLQTYIKALGVQQAEYKKLTDYINFKCKQFIGSMSINSTTAQCSIFVISRAFQKQRIDQTFMTLAIMIQDNWDSLVKNRTNKNQCEYLIIKNCSMGNYNQKYKMLVPVKISQFTSFRASLKINQQMSDLKRLQSIKIEDQTKPPGSPPLKPSMQKKFSLQQSFDITQFDQVNVGKKKKSQILKLEDAQKAKKIAQQQQKSQQSLDKTQQSLTGIFAGLAKAVDKNSKQNNNNLNSKIQIQQKKQQNEKVVKVTQDKKNGILKTNSQQKKQQKKQQNKQITGASMFMKLLQIKQQNPKQKEEQKKVELLDNMSQQNQQQQNLNNKKTKAPIIHYQKQHCQQCSIKSQKLQQLTEQLSHKRQQLESANQQLKVSQNQIQALKMQLTHLKQQGIKHQNQQSNKHQVQKLKKQISDGTQKFNNLMNDLFKFQKQNKNLRNQVQELGINNSLLKSRLEEQSYGIGMNSKNNQKQQQLNKMNELMKKNIQNKNKQLQALHKKNKDLTAQLDQISKIQLSSNVKEGQKVRNLEKQKQDLLLKMKQLGELVVKQQQQKLGLSAELFDLRRQSTLSITNTPNLTQEKNQTEQSSLDGLKKRASQCLIF